jgi:hypothetical protein
MKTLLLVAPIKNLLMNFGYQPDAKVSRRAHRTSAMRAQPVLIFEE